MKYGYSGLWFLSWHLIETPQVCYTIGRETFLIGDLNLKLNIPKHKLPLFLALLFSLVLFACGQSLPGDTPVPSAAVTLESLPSPTPTLPPTATQLPSLLVLLAPPEADPLIAGELQPALSDLAAQMGLRFQARPSVAAVELEQIKVLVALPPNPGLAELVAAAPQTQFLAIGFSGLEAMNNLSVVGALEERPDRLAFLAGYTAAVATADWRVAVISEAETVPGQVARQAFTNGVTYYCGLCRPPYPPFPAGGYPLSVELAPTASPADWQAALTYLSSWQVGAVYVQPSLADQRFLDAVAQAGFNFILSGPAPAGLQGSWVASLGYKDPLQDALGLLPDLIAGRGGQRVDLPLGFSQVNPELLSPGRQHLAEGVLADLLAGYIGTGVDPLTGENP